MTKPLLDPDVLTSLWESYFHDARLFFILHAVLLIVWAVAMIQFLRWRPHEATREEVSARAEFVRGVVGLFLIIGIAGTFVGLFEFAVKTVVLPASAVAGGVPAEPKPEPVETALRTAMARAFPVGFFGLAATLLLHLAVDATEFLKARDVDAAKRKSLEAEMHLLVMHTAQIAAHVQPLGALGDTISRGIEPLIGSIKEALAETKRVLEEQGSRLQSGKDELIAASQKIAASTDALLAASAQAAGLAEHAARAADAAVAVSEKAATTLTEVHRQTIVTGRDARETIRVAAEAFDGIVQRAEALSDVLDKVPETLSTRITDALREPVAAGIRDYQDKIFTAIGGAFAPIQTNQTSILQKAQELNGSVVTTLNTITDSNQRLENKLTASVDNLTESFRSSIATDTASLKRATEEAGATVAGASSSAVTLCNVAASAATAAVDRLSSTVDTQSDRIRAIASASESFTGALGTATSQVVGTATEFSAAAKSANLKIQKAAADVELAAQRVAAKSATAPPMRRLIQRIKSFVRWP